MKVLVKRIMTLWRLMLIVASVFACASCYVDSQGVNNACYNNVVLCYGWKPVGIGNFMMSEKEQYCFVYSNGNLKAIYANEDKEPFVSGEALIIPECLSTYGEGPLVIQMRNGSPIAGWNCRPAGSHGYQYYLYFDGNGRLIRYKAVEERFQRILDANKSDEETHVAELLTTTFKPTYDQYGRLTYLEVCEDEIGCDFEREFYGYDEDNQLVFQATCTTTCSEAWVIIKQTQGDENITISLGHKRILAERLADGTYRIETFQTNEEGSTIIISNELPAEFQKYIKELPIPRDTAKDDPS